VRYVAKNNDDDDAKSAAAANSAMKIKASEDTNVEVCK
jgi:hypothetical protein